MHNPTDPGLLDELPELFTIWEVDGVSSVDEVRSAINGLKNTAAGADGLPAELLKYGGAAMVDCKAALTTDIWNTGCVPHQWKDANIVNVYKKKDDRNSRGISLLSTTGKVLARILLVTLLERVAEEVLPATQCAFRRCRGTVGMIFEARDSCKKSAGNSTEISCL